MRPTESSQSPARKRVIIDTDMAGDDWMAMLYLFRRPDVEVIGVTVTGAGEAHCEPGVRNALKLLSLANYPPIPVTCGRETPLRGDHVFPQMWRDGVDNLGGMTLPDSPYAPSPLNAVELLAQLIQQSPQKVYILALGPLTNVAEALQAAPSLAQNIADIVIMGGAVDVPGNIHDGDTPIVNHAAEWNIYVDPYAANVVFQSGAPVTLVGLDATNYALLTPAFYERLQNEHTTPEATFIYDLITRNRRFLQSGAYYFWDPLAAAILTDESLAEYRMRRIWTEEEEGAESGCTRPDDPRGAEIRVAMRAHNHRFEQVFFDTLNGRVQ